MVLLVDRSLTILIDDKISTSSRKQSCQLWTSANEAVDIETASQMVTRMTQRLVLHKQPTKDRKGKVL